MEFFNWKGLNKIRDGPRNLNRMLSYSNGQNTKNLLYRSSPSTTVDEEDGFACNFSGTPDGVSRILVIKCTLICYVI